MKIFIKLSFFLTVILVGCNRVGNGNQSIDQLKSEVLSLACDDNFRRYLEYQINSQRAILTERQMIKSLQNMKKDIKCDSGYNN